mmetsp:Transcript_8914/g.21749  ORF Transcript_8914/g.21749 Transcript_8914/m.21749 type:complete len:792 (+) Transcript_8914:3-2378(+)
MMGGGGGGPSAASVPNWTGNGSAMNNAAAPFNNQQQPNVVSVGMGGAGSQGQQQMQQQQQQHLQQVSVPQLGGPSLMSLDSRACLISDSPSKAYTGVAGNHGVSAAASAAAMVDHEEHELPDLGTARFELRSFLGSGGEGVVYEALDRVENQLCAIKIGNRTAQKNKGFEKEYAIYSHCVKHRVTAIPRLFDTRIAAIQGSHLEVDPKPDYLALELLGPSIRMMLQAVCNKRAQLAEQGLLPPAAANRGSTMELRSIYVVAEKMIETLEQLHKVKVLHHDVKPQNVVFRDIKRTLDTDSVTNSDSLALIDLGMSYFVAENLKPKRHCRFCGSMDYSSRASRYRCQPSRRDDLESLSYLLLWLVMGNRSYKAWRAAVLEPYWEMLSVLFEEKSDIAEILSCPSKNGGPYAAALHRANDENKVFIRRSAVQNCKKPDKKCDLGLFNTTMTTRPDDIIEGNLPKLNREKVPEKLLYFVLYCQSLEFAEVPNYAGLKAMFHRSSSTEGQELSIAQSNAEEIPQFVLQRMHTHCMVKDVVPSSWGLRQPAGDLGRGDEQCGLAAPPMMSRENPFSLAKPTYATPTRGGDQHVLLHQQHEAQQYQNVQASSSNPAVPQQEHHAVGGQHNLVMHQYQSSSQREHREHSSCIHGGPPQYAISHQQQQIDLVGSSHQHQQGATIDSGSGVQGQGATGTGSSNVNLQESLRRRAEYATARSSNAAVGGARNPYVKYVSPLDDETYTLGDENPNNASARRVPGSGTKPRLAGTAEEGIQVKQQNFILGTSPMGKKTYLSTRQ